VVLARITLDTNGIEAIDYECRRMVVSFANTWCPPAINRPPRGYLEPDADSGPPGQPPPLGQEQAREVIRQHTNIKDQDLPAQLLEVLDRPATDLNGVQSTSELGKMLTEKGLTIRDVAGTTKDDFADWASRGATAHQVGSRIAQAQQVWEHARVVQEAVAPLPPG
jgi:hypothetical protein